MSKLEFIAKQLSKAAKKRYEHYVVSRIFHGLNDLDIKLITQQCITRPDGIALTDVFLPQIKLHIEIDEPYHLSQSEKDRLRAADIINATGHRIERITITTIEDVNRQVDRIIELIKQLKSSCSRFIPWDIDAEMRSSTYISRGYIDIEDDCAFRTMVEAANCFGNNIRPKGIWKGGANHGVHENKCIWFPKLYSNDEWDNNISHDEMTIRESSNENRLGHFNEFINDKRERIVFAHAKGPLRDVLYRFKGEYKLDVDNSSFETGLIWRRINTRVRTYAHNHR